MSIDSIEAQQMSSATGRPLTRLGRENRERILDAGLAVFSRYGLRGSRLEEIADGAGLSKTNLLYYVRSKDDLYLAVLERTLDMWLEPLKAFDETSDPREAITAYIERKLELSRDFPDASRLFAQEILQGAPVLRGRLETDLRGIIAEKSALMKRWIATGRMGPCDPVQWIFMVWAVTQHHADFAVQTEAVTGSGLADPAFFAAARSAIVTRLTAGLFPERTA
jgi:TetR/AcrR family transcriptional regulator